MVQFHDYFSEDYRYALCDLKYKKVEIYDQKNRDLLLNDVLRAEKQEDCVAVFFTRRLNFDPTGIFEIEATYKILFDPLPKNNWKSLTEEEIVNMLAGSALDSIDQVAARMSLLISQTLFSANHDPIILPPNVVLENKT